MPGVDGSSARTTTSSGQIRAATISLTPPPLSRAGHTVPFASSFLKKKEKEKYPLKLSRVLSTRRQQLKTRNVCLYGEAKPVGGPTLF
jgi:hypothetical protein